MKWLQWSEYELETGLGGVEVHARSLARELSNLGVECKLSNNPKDLEGDWDVIHTHGSSGLPASVSTRAFKLHTFHGETLGRMWACDEYFWIGGYLAAFAEYRALRTSDACLSVNPDLKLLGLARRLNKPSEIFENGWDSAHELEALPPELESKLGEGEFWAIVGRGYDPVKGADRVAVWVQSGAAPRLVAAPGEGFEELEQVVCTGRLTPAQVRTLMVRARGLLHFSRYEGSPLPLVVREALSLGVTVVAMPTPGNRDYQGRVQGLYVAERVGLDAFEEAFKRAQNEARIEAREERARYNRAALATWAQSSQKALDFVRKLLGSKQ